MNLYSMLLLMGLIICTFGLALPWIVSNNLLPLPLDILLLIMISWVYGRIAIFYYKKFFPKFKNMLQGKKNG